MMPVNAEFVAKHKLPESKSIAVEGDKKEVVAIFAPPNKCFK